MITKSMLRRVVAQVYVAQHKVSTKIARTVNEATIKSEYMRAVCEEGENIRPQVAEVIKGKKDLCEVMNAMDMTPMEEGMRQDFHRLGKLIEKVAVKAIKISNELQDQ